MDGCKNNLRHTQMSYLWQKGQKHMLGERPSARNAGNTSYLHAENTASRSIFLTRLWNETEIDWRLNTVAHWSTNLPGSVIDSRGTGHISLGTERWPKPCSHPVWNSWIKAKFSWMLCQLNYVLTERFVKRIITILKQKQSAWK